MQETECQVNKWIEKRIFSILSCHIFTYITELGVRILPDIVRQHMFPSE